MCCTQNCKSQCRPDFGESSCKRNNLTAATLRSAQWSAELKKYIYGKPNQPRHCEPSMFEILTWQDPSCRCQDLALNCQMEEEMTHEKPQVQKGCLKSKKQIEKGKKVQLKQSRGPQPRGESAPQNLQSQHKPNVPAHTLHKHCQNRQQIHETRHLQRVKSQKNISDHCSYNQKTDQRFSKKAQERSALNDKGALRKKTVRNQQKQQFRKHQTNHLSTEYQKSSTDEEVPNYLKQKTATTFEKGSEQEAEFLKAKELAIKKFKQTSRDLANTSFLTYFNRPPFENYGRGNKSTHSGVLYGDYMYSHNVFPHAGDNKPGNQQTYVSALKKAKSVGSIRPEAPMTRQLEEEINRSFANKGKIYPKRNQGDNIPIQNNRRLEDIPRFNLKSQGRERVGRNQMFLNSQEQNCMQPELFLDQSEHPQYLSDKNEIEGREISYYQKFNKTKVN